MDKFADSLRKSILFDVQIKKFVVIDDNRAEFTTIFFLDEGQVHINADEYFRIGRVIEFHARLIECLIISDYRAEISKETMAEIVVFVIVQERSRPVAPDGEELFILFKDNRGGMVPLVINLERFHHIH